MQTFGPRFFLFCPSWLYVLCYLLEFDAKEKVKKNHVTFFILAFWCSFFPENQLMIKLIGFLLYCLNCLIQSQETSKYIHLNWY